MSHEIGHTGGLWHPFKGKGDDGKYYNGIDENPNDQRFANGKPGDASSQADVDAPTNDYDYANNFMSYLTYAQERLPWTSDNKLRTQPGKATPGQVYQILFNYKRGNLNHNDVPK